jgi:hypothetical protein
MYNLDTAGLILLFSTIIIGGGLYLMSLNKTNKTHKKLLDTMPEDVEIAEEIYPVIQFPPNIETEPTPELPWGYNDEKITIMARDPETIYCYWDISDKKCGLLKQIYGQKWDRSFSVLRVYDITGVKSFDGLNAHYYYDTVINEHTGNWYLHVGHPNRMYCVDLGRILSDGAFVLVARSNFAITPRNCVSDRTDPEWMLVSDHERRLFARIGEADGMSSLYLFQQKPH